MGDHGVSRDAAYQAEVIKSQHLFQPKAALVNGIYQLGQGYTCCTFTKSFTIFTSGDMNMSVPKLVTSKS